MAHSFGYSRTEHFKDDNSTEALLCMLIDIVSRGGNFLLDIGPTADGRIPPLMEERPVEMGDWLEVNGKAQRGGHLPRPRRLGTAIEIGRRYPRHHHA